VNIGGVNYMNLTFTKDEQETYVNQYQNNKLKAPSVLKHKKVPEQQI